MHRRIVACAKTFPFWVWAKKNRNVVEEFLNPVVLVQRGRILGKTIEVRLQVVSQAIHFLFAESMFAQALMHHERI